MRLTWASCSASVIAQREPLWHRFAAFLSWCHPLFLHTGRAYRLAQQPLSQHGIALHCIALHCKVLRGDVSRFEGMHESFNMLTQLRLEAVREVLLELLIKQVPQALHCSALHCTHRKGNATYLLCRSENESQTRFQSPLTLYGIHQSWLGHPYGVRTRSHPYRPVSARRRDTIIRSPSNRKCHHLRTSALLSKQSKRPKIRPERKLEHLYKTIFFSLWIRVHSRTFIL